MAPSRKSRSVNKQFTNTDEASPSKDKGTANKSRLRKKKLTDMLGPQWSKEELQRFYEAYRKFGKDWKRVAMAVHNRTVEMVESLYTMNTAYLSLPEGAASVVGLIAMMTDHYSVLEGSDSEQESNDGIGVIQKPCKRSKAKVRSNTTRETDGLGDTSRSQTVALNYGCLSLLKKKRSSGGQVRAVGKRTPRFPVKYNYDRSNKEKYISPSRHRQKMKIDVEDDDVAHEVALVLAEASHRDGSPQVSCTPNKRKEGSESEMTSGKNFQNEKVEDGGDASLGSTEAFNGDYPGRSYFSNKTDANIVVSPQKGKKLSGKKRDVFGIRCSHVDNVKEASSGTGQNVSGVKKKLPAEVTGSTSLCSLSPKKSKKVLFGGDEKSAFDALQTLADLSLMMPETGVEFGDVPVKEEKESAADNPTPREIAPGSQLTEKPKALSRKKGDQSPATGLISKSERGSPPNVNSVPEVGTRKRKQKSPVSKISRSEVQMDAKVIKIRRKGSADPGRKPASKNRRSSHHTASPPQHGLLGRLPEHSSSNTDVRKEGDDSAVSSAPAPAVDQVMPKKLKRRRKSGKAQIQRTLRELHFSDALINVKSKAFRPSRHDKELGLWLDKLYNCLSNHHVQRWCIYEWFYSAIDYPWFSKSEFVEYLYHVGLGHVPRLTRVEWGVIRSSLGKPRRFSDQFLKEEKEKLYYYRDSVRSHYSELRMGTRDGLPTDLAPPLTVGQCVVAIHPLTREIHNGSVLTVDHDRCQVQFDLPELGVESVVDIDCMPMVRSQNLPASFNRSFAVNKFFESLKLQNINVPGEDRKKEYTESVPIRRKENVDGISHVTTSYPANNLLKQGKEGLTNPNSEVKVGHGEVISPQQGLVSQPFLVIQMLAKADVRALAELNRALDRKNALVTELKHMNDDVSEDNSFRGIDSFKKQYAAVLVQLDEVFDQVSSALHSLRQRNTYPACSILASQREKEHGFLPLEPAICDAQESASHIYEIVETSKNKARKMVDAAMQAMSSLKDGAISVEKIEEAIDYVSHHLSVDSSSKPALANQVNGCSASPYQPMSSGSNLVADHSPDSKANKALDVHESQVPAEIITNCVATLIMIQKCTERQFPPSDVAQVLDLAVTGLQPCCSQNLPLYADIQKCMGIIRNQIFALVPT